MINLSLSLSPHLSSIGSLIEEAQKLATELEVVECSVVLRDGNQVAHKLARWAKFFDSSRVRVDENPAFILDILIEDLNGIPISSLLWKNV